MFIVYITSHHDVHYKHLYNVHYHTHTHSSVYIHKDTTNMIQNKS